jgi:hypothetical protein
MQLAVRDRSAALSVAVFTIIKVCPKEEMPRVYTSWRVATVENTHPIRDRSNVKFVRDPVRLPHLTVMNKTI